MKKETKSVKQMTRITPTIKKKLDKEAAKRFMTPSAYVCLKIEESLKGCRK